MTVVIHAALGDYAHKVATHPLVVRAEAVISYRQPEKVFAGVIIEPLSTDGLRTALQRLEQAQVTASNILRSAHGKSGAHYALTLTRELRRWHGGTSQFLPCTQVPVEDIPAVSKMLGGEP